MDNHQAERTLSVLTYASIVSTDKVRIESRWPLWMICR